MLTKKKKRKKKLNNLKVEIKLYSVGMLGLQPGDSISGDSQRADSKEAGEDQAMYTHIYSKE